MKYNLLFSIFIGLLLTSPAMATAPIYGDPSNTTAEYLSLIKIDSSGNVGIGTGTPAANLHLNGSISASAWTTNGIGIRQDGNVFTDNTSTGTVSVSAINSLKAPTMAAANAVTFVQGATLYVEPPVAGTNVTLTNKPAIYSTGAISTTSAFEGVQVIVGTTNGAALNSRLSIITGVTGSSWTVSGSRFAVGAATDIDNSSTGGTTIGTRVASSFAAPIFASTNTVTLTNAVTNYVAGAPTAGANTTITNAYANYTAGGNSFFGGNGYFIGVPALSSGLSVTPGSSAATFSSTGGKTFNVEAAIQNDPSNTGMIAVKNTAAIGQTTYTSTGTLTVTTANTLLLAGPPIASTNTTIGTANTFNVLSGNSNFGGALVSSSSMSAASFIPTGTTVPVNGLYLPAANTLGFATNSLQAMTLNANGFLGIGTSSAGAPLDIWYGYASGTGGGNLPGILIGSDGTSGRTANNSKFGYISSPTYALSGGPPAYSVDDFEFVNDSTSNNLNLGTTSTGFRPLTAIHFYTGSSVSGTGGTLAATIAGDQTATFAKSITAASFIPSSSTVPTVGIYLPAANTFSIATGTTQAALWDSSQRYVQGTSSSISMEGGSVASEIFSTAGQIGATRYNSVNGSSIILGMQPNASPTGHTAAASGNTFGKVDYCSDDGTTFCNAPSVRLLGAVSGTVSTGVIPGAFQIQTETTGGVLTTALTISNAQAATFGGTVTGNSFIPASSTLPTNGLYLPAANTPGMAANSLDVVRYLPTTTAVDYITMKGSAAGSPGVNTIGVAGTDTDISLNLTTKGAGVVQINGTSITPGGGAELQISFQPGLITAVTNTKGVFGKFVKASTVDNIEASAVTFTCASNPTITLYECGTDATCATPTTIGSATVTASGQAFDGSISNAAIAASHYVGWAISAGTCTALDISATAQAHAN